MPNIISAFAHFPDGPNVGIHSDDLRPVFESLPADDQDWTARTVNQFDRTDIKGVASKLGVPESVAAGLIALLHENG